MSDPYCLQHHPRRYSQCGCSLPKPPAKPLMADVCRWCLTCTYAAPFCRRLGHWRLITEEYEENLARWQETYGSMVAERRVEKVLKPTKPRSAPRASRPIAEFPIPSLPNPAVQAFGHRGC